MELTNLFKRFVQTFCYTPNRWYDNVPDTPRFLIFCIPYTILYSLGVFVHPSFYIVMGVFGLWRIGYLKNMYDFSKPTQRTT